MVPGVLCGPAEAGSLWQAGLSCCGAAERSASELLTAAYSSFDWHAKAISRRRKSRPEKNLISVASSGFEVQVSKGFFAFQVVLSDDASAIDAMLVALFYG